MAYLSIGRQNVLVFGAETELLLEIPYWRLLHTHQPPLLIRIPMVVPLLNENSIRPVSSFVTIGGRTRITVKIYHNALLF